MADIDTKWGFGQLLAMMTLLFPAFAVVEAFKAKDSISDPESISLLEVYADELDEAS
ncbi:hypothetical protein EK21DRAFT_108270 [Setomelanomma holmii]|uniref:Uncharacterized protein n=1 Tax=Setomelanomma holmii TaxID=210430 RepID=A0A9P4LNT3_9PLEO|nr:hypothetical protein EK21DRAFT_108270 [Setomelanomma holmii]